MFKTVLTLRLPWQTTPDQKNMGIYSSVRSSTDLDAMGQFTGEAYLWQDKTRESFEQGTGLKGALDWRDGRYRDYRASK